MLPKCLLISAFTIVLSTSSIAQVRIGDGIDVNGGQVRIGDGIDINGGQVRIGGTGASTRTTTEVESEVRTDIQRTTETDLTAVDKNEYRKQVTKSKGKAGAGSSLRTASKVKTNSTTGYARGSLRNDSSEKEISRKEVRTTRTTTTSRSTGNSVSVGDDISVNDSGVRIGNDISVDDSGVRVGNIRVGN